jgi:hypothetical protein
MRARIRSKQLSLPDAGNEKGMKKIVSQPQSSRRKDVLVVAMAIMK